jgi:hypothetical protein
MNALVCGEVRLATLCWLDDITEFVICKPRVRRAAVSATDVTHILGTGTGKGGFLIGRQFRVVVVHTGRLTYPQPGAIAVVGTEPWRARASM